MSEDVSSSLPKGAEPPPGSRRKGHTRREYAMGLLLVLVTAFVFCEVRLWQPDTVFGSGHTAIEEAGAWLSGRLDLPERRWDTAEVDGRVYSYFPPMYTIFALPFVATLGGVPHLALVALAAAVVVLAYVLFVRLTGSVLAGAALAIGYVCGTSLWPVLRLMLLGAAPYYVNHTLAAVGVLVFLIAFFGQRRIWLACVGLGVAALSRQLSLACALPLVWWAFQAGPSANRWPRRIGVAAALAVVVSIPLMLNTLKFGHPLDSGYMHNYERRDDGFARDARQYGLFSPHYVPRNLYYTNIGLPRLHEIEMAGEKQAYLRPNRMGTGIWWTTPLLVWLVFDFRRIIGDPSRRALLAGVVVIFFALMFWHGTGWDQRGYNRYSLDYVPVMLALVASRCFVGRRRWISVTMIAWSLLYFLYLMDLPHIRVL